MAALPLKERIEPVRRKLKEVNGGAGDFSLDPDDGMPRKGVVSDVAVYDLWPLAALTSLNAIDVTATTSLTFVRSLTSTPSSPSITWRPRQHRIRCRRARPSTAARSRSSVPTGEGGVEEGEK